MAKEKPQTGLFHLYRGGENIMTRNVCGRERTWRGITGLILIILGIVMNSWIIGTIGVIPLLTAIFSFSPINQAMNRNTCRHRKDPIHQNPS